MASRILLGLSLVLLSSSMPTFGQNADIGELRQLVRDAAARGIDVSEIRRLTELRDSNTGFRVWKAKEGNYELKARFVDVDLTDQSVTLITMKGDSKKIAIAILSPGDGDFIKQASELERKIPHVALTVALQLNALQASELTASKDELSTAKDALARARADLQQTQLELQKQLPSNSIADGGGLPVLDQQKLEAFGSDYVGKRVALIAAEHVEIDNTWVRLGIPEREQDKLVGFFIKDSKGNLIQHVFALKADWGLFLADLKRGTRINIEGVVAKVGDNYAVFASRIEKAPAK